jgi:hypothetical protein
MSATSSALFSAVKTTRPMSSPMARVTVGAVKRSGVARSDMPAVIPNQVKHTQAGFVIADLNTGIGPRLPNEGVDFRMTTRE